MASLAGNVTIDPTTGAASGSGLALSLFTVMFALPSYASLVVGPSMPLSAVIAAKKQLAETCNTFALVADGVRWNVSGQTSAYAAQVNDCVVCNAAISVTLPAPGSVPIGSSIVVKAAVGTSTVTVSGGSLIDSLFASLSLAAPASAIMVNGGIHWFQVGKE